MRGNTKASLSGEHRAKSVQPESDGRVADLDPAFAQQIFDIPQEDLSSPRGNDRRRAEGGERTRTDPLNDFMQ